MKITTFKTIIPGKQRTLENYITNCPQKNLTAIQELFANQFQEIDCLVIKSTCGNGGTHLLEGIYNQLRNDNKKMIWFWNEQLINNFNVFFKNSILPNLNELFYKNTFVFIDCLGSSYTNKKPFIKWFKSIFSASITKGNKFIISIPVNKIEESDTPSFFFRNIRSKIITSDKPSQECYFQIVSNAFLNQNLHPPLEVLKHISKLKVSCVRVLEGLCIGFIAKCNLERKKMNLRSLKEFLAAIMKNPINKNKL